jgi:DNA-binding SARP family transcriptional activator
VTAGPGPTLDLRALGPLQVLSGGEELALGSPKQRAVLAVLLISVNRVVAVDRLVEELWGGEAPARAMASLQAYVSRLRRLLQPEGANRGRSDVLVTQSPGYLLRVDPNSIDAVRFEQQATEASRLLAAGDAAAALVGLDRALALWRGPAYADFGFDDFAQGEIARLDELRLAATEDRIAALLDTGQAPGAVAEAEVLVRDRPLREGAWASLMTGLYRTGRQADALRAYQRARKVMGEELGIEPGPALQALEQRILQQSLELEPVAGPVATAMAPAPPPRGPAPAAPPPAPVAQEPLVGRDREQERLREAVAAVAAGSGRAVVLHGEPGIGKTRLAREAARLAAEAGAAVGSGVCVEGHLTAAYWPWTHALRGLLGHLEPQDVPAPVREALAELAQLDPPLARWAPDAVAPEPLADPELARARLQRAGVDAVVGLAVARPVTLVLEDLQWADQPSLQLLSLLASEVPAARVLIVATYRDQEVGAGLAAALGTIEHLAGTVDLALGGLDPWSVHRFVELTAGEDVSEAVAGSIALRTAGNPLFVGELTRLLRSERALTEQAVQQAPVPAGVRDVIRRRIDRLPPQTTTVLTVAAIIGRSFELDLLERVTKLPGDELLDRVESAVATGLVTEDDGVLGSFGFTHDLVRDTLQAAVGGTRLARVHHRVAQALLERGDAGDPARPFELAHHLVQAVPLVAPDEVVGHVVAAADAAVTRHAFDQAEDELRQALTLIQLIPGSARERHELAVRVRLARVLTLTRGHGSPEEREHARRAAELAMESEARPETTHALWGDALSTGMAGDLVTPMTIGEKLIAWGDERGDRAAACMGHALVGGFAWHGADLDTAARHLSLVIEAVDSGELDPRLFHDRTRGVWSRATHALVAWLAGRDDEAVALSDDALRRAAGPGQEFGRLYALCFAAWLAAFREDRPAGRRHAEAGIEQADALGFGQLRVLCRVMLAAAQDDPSDRLDGLVEATRDWEATGARLYRGFLATLRAGALLDLGRTEAATDLLAAALASATASGEVFYEPETHRLLGLAATRQERPDEAAAHLERAVAVAGAHGLVALGRRAAASLEALGPRR